MKANRLTLLIAAAMLFVMPAGAQTIGINVVLRIDPTESVLADLATHGRVRDVIAEIRGVTMQARASELPTIQALSYVAAANADAERSTGPVTPLAVANFSNGLSTWDMDAINVTDFGFNNRQVPYDGSGVYVAVLDTGLISNWPIYFPSGRIATEFAVSFGGGGGDVGNVSTQPNKWGLDQNSHGTHVTSTILGYSLGGTPINGVAPNARVIPVKVLNQNGSGWSSVIARGITYIADLKSGGSLGASPVVINMSLGGSRLDALEKAAIDYAIAHGVLIVAAAGNSGNGGVGYPGGYAPVISVAAAGWIGQWKPGADGNPNNWWYADNVPEAADNTAQFYIAGFSSRQLTGKPAQLDVTAPGAWTVGPYQVNGQVSYYYLSGTSMASPHVAGIVALLAQRDFNISQAQAEGVLKTSAQPMGNGCRSVIAAPGAAAQNICWGAGVDPAGSDADGAGFVTIDAALATPY